MAAALRLRVLTDMREVPRDAWDRLVGDGSPFLEWAWLQALEESGCVSEDVGWTPQHLTLWDGDVLVGGCPLYVRTDSFGEFIFDQSWASAAHRAGIPYYPKLLVAVPFTPATGQRLLAAPGRAADVVPALAELLESMCDAPFSSVHVNFCEPDEAAGLAARGWLLRTDRQFHWQNEGFRSFDDYLASLRSKRRNQVRRELRSLDEENVTITAHVGDAIPPGIMPTMFEIYRTNIEHQDYGCQYLNLPFFELVGERFRDRLCLVVARQDGEVVAGTFNVQKAGVLYGRYWGALRPMDNLHFNVAYYAGIRHAIAAGLTRFEPGAGGPFKMLRGFDASETRSVHWVRVPRLRAAIADFLERERVMVAAEIAWLQERTALRRDGGGEDGS